MPRTEPPSTTLELTAPAQFLKGCGAERAALLARLDLSTVRDLIFFFPRDYLDLTDLRRIEQLEEGPLVSVLGMVEEVELADRGFGRSIVGLLVRQDYQYLRAVWFNQPFQFERFKRGQRVLLSGKAKRRGQR